MTFGAKTLTEKTVQEWIANAIDKIHTTCVENFYDLTDDAWVSGPDLAPQKFLLSQ